MAQSQALNQHPNEAHRQGRQDQGSPVVDFKIGHAQPGGISPQHVEGTMGKIHHAQQTKNHGQAQAEQSIKRAIHQPEHELPQNNGQRETEYFSHKGRG